MGCREYVVFAYDDSAAAQGIAVISIVSMAGGMVGSEESGVSVSVFVFGYGFVEFRDGYHKRIISDAVYALATEDFGLV